MPLKPVPLDEKTDTIMLNRTPPKQAINSAYELPSTEQLIRYLHACAGYPTHKTWVKDIRAGNYVSWPGLAVKKVNKFYPETDETPKGHIRQTRQGVRSTKEKVVVRDKNNKAVPRTKQHDLYVCVDQVKDKIYTNQTGEFPITSSRGNKYIMIMCNIDGNAVLVEPMKNKTEDEMVETYQKMINRLKTGGIFPKNHILDNEISAKYKK